MSFYFCRELEGHYDLYLRLKAGVVESERSNPKFIEVIFSKIAEMMKNPDTQQAVMQFTPVLYEGVIKNYK